MTVLADIVDLLNICMYSTNRLSLQTAWIVVCKWFMHIVFHLYRSKLLSDLRSLYTWLFSYN